MNERRWRTLVWRELGPPTSQVPNSHPNGVIPFHATGVRRRLVRPQAGPRYRANAEERPDRSTQKAAHVLTALMVTTLALPGFLLARADPAGASGGPRGLRGSGS